MSFTFHCANEIKIYYNLSLTSKLALSNNYLILCLSFVDKAWFNIVAIDFNLLDPYKETCDIDEKNNTWNIKDEPSRFDIFKGKTVGRGQSTGGNPMQKAKGGK